MSIGGLFMGIFLSLIGKSSFHLGFINFAVNIAGFKQFFVFAHGDYLSRIKNDYLVCVLNGRNALCNNDFGGIGDLFRKSLADKRIGFGIDRTC